MHISVYVKVGTQSDDSFIRNDSKPLRKEAEKILKGVHDKSSNLTLTELKEFLFRCAAALVYGKQVRETF